MALPGDGVECGREERRSALVASCRASDAHHMRSRQGREGSGSTGFASSVEIRRPPADVYAFLADVQEAEPIPRYANVRMAKEPDGRTSVGTRWHEQVRLLPGCWLHVESVVTEVEEPVRLGMDFSSRWFAGHMVYELTPTADGCVLRQREVIRPCGSMALLGGFLGRSRRRHVEERLQDIKAVLEKQGARTQTSASSARP